MGTSVLSNTWNSDFTKYYDLQKFNGWYVNFDYLTDSKLQLIRFCLESECQVQLNLLFLLLGQFHILKRG